MRKKFTTVLLIFTTFFTLSSQNEISEKELSDVLITAKRAKIYPDESRIVTSIEKSEIEKLAVQNLDELLDRIAGLDARQRGTGGVQADLSVRGGTFDQVLILLNGVNITDPQTGHYNLDVPVELNNISRIEILQGSAARIYGPNAFSGAINIITSESSKNQVLSKNHIGSYATFSQSISGNYYSEAFQTFGSASYKKSDGFIKNTDYKSSNVFWQSKLNTKNAGYFRFQAAVQIKDFGANSFYAASLPNQFENTKTFLSSLEWNLEKSFLTLNSQIYWREHFDKFTFDRYAAIVNANYHKTDITGGKITSNFDWKKYGNTTLGVDLRNEHIFSNKLGTFMETPIPVPYVKDSVFYTREDNRLIFTMMLDHSLNIYKWNFSGGFSATYNKQFGTNVNGGIDIAYKFGKSSRLFTAFNSAVRFPTFTDLYYSDAIRTANPNLKPEKSTTFELGGKIAEGNFKADAVAYYRCGNNVIDWVKMTESEKYQSKNLTQVNAIGSDANIEYSFENKYLKSINLGYSFLNLDKNAAVFDSKYALDYLNQKLVLGLNHKIWNKLSANWNISWYKRTGTYVFENKSVDYEPYTLLNARLLWKSENVDINFDVNNILNQKYVEFGGLEQPKININAGITLRI